MKEEAGESAPLVSVLLASHDHERFVEEAVRSATAQEGVPFELVVVDDGSTDRSPEILERLRAELGFRYVRRPNRGLVPTMNELLSMARGKYVCSLASDDVMPPDRLRIQSAFMEAHPGAPICFGQAVRMDAEGRLDPAPDPRYLPGVPEVSFEDVFLGRKELHGCTEMIDRATFLEMGGYDEEFAVEDFQTMLKFLSRFGKVPVLDAVCVRYRTHSTNISGDKNWLYESTLAVVDRYSSHPLHAKAAAVWKSHWFSMLARVDKREAVRMLPRLWSFSLPFLKRFPTLFVPRFLLGR